MYSKKNHQLFGIKGYNLPKQAEKPGMQMKNSLKFRKVDSKKEKTFLNIVIAHAKGVPDPRKYQRPQKWTELIGKGKGKFLKDKRVTIF